MTRLESSGQRSAVTAILPGIVATKPSADIAARVRDALRFLKRHSTKRNREGLSRYGIRANNVLGASMTTIQTLGKMLGTDHTLAIALWDSGCYEARHLTAFVADAEAVTAAQMDRWARGFDNWAVCDTLCFKLFDRTPHAWRKVDQWSGRREEYIKRAAFALLASLALHDKKADDAQFLRTLPLIERAATDERNFVKKGVSWALRSIGRRNQALNSVSVETARKLVDAPEASARWIGRDAFKELTSAAVQRRLAARKRTK
jgi:3-methyladenine DNA glycosylase AlkD